MGFGSKSDNTVMRRDCSYSEDANKQVCTYEKVDKETGESRAAARIEVKTDENGKPIKVEEGAEGFEDDEIRDLKNKTKNKASNNSPGGAFAGNKEV